MKTTYLSDNIKSILAITTVSLTIGYFFMCSIRDLKPDPQILIAMVTANSQVLSYFFGSSTKSNDNAAAVTNSGDINLKK